MNDEKRDLIKEYLENKGYVYILFYNPPLNVVIPKYLKNVGLYTKLRLSLRYEHLPEFLSEEIRVTLSFKGESFECKIPYEYIQYAGEIRYEDDLEGSLFFPIDIKKHENIAKANLAELEIEEDDD